MADWPQTMKTALDTSAAAWPLAAGLSIVIWSKMRARQVEPARVRVRPIG